ncbi:MULTISPECIES: D-alanyl-D-alanine carboxypeptidase [unclassified Streptomyces]|uniref:D-alanyl-D-alanine carboxypeptidase n=1 Tax=unclassified Streptomyces TaxID=2593676 RepID=UPI000FB16B7A|nr:MULTISPECIES: D-alanyl-D-alanine carboxypeptidase [unclassified Streptomyces]RSS18700.1 D-alanyl-D-alanine carboxypeptidase [Streptomyces sp. WAC05458]
MEEASVAGESPDRSKQHESSEEPTSGSAGPVPEARTGASESRDPRLAVAREDAKSSASAGSGESAGAAGSRGGVDTATRVLSVRDARDGDGDEAEAEDAADADASEDGGTGPAAANDGRLRDAVAAWVATAEERAAASARREDAADDTEDTPDAGADEAADAAKATEATEGARQDAGADTEPAEDAGGHDTETGTETDAGDGDADPDAEASSGAVSDSPESADDDSSQDTADDTGTDSQGSDGPATAAGAGTAADGPDTDTVDAAADSDGPDAGDREAEADESAEAAKAAKAAKADETDDEKADGGDGNRDGDGDGDGDAGSGKDGVDQPTAVFKAVRPTAREVDQPTTMLKLGGAAAPKKPGRDTESDAERTSKFVALRQPDDPATRKPPQKAPSTPPTPPEASGAPRTGTTTAVPHVGPERTTQQPLPPKPPLDLLAELTNTPPPPETPLRTTVRRVKIWTPLVLLLVIILGIVQAMRPLPSPELDLTARESFTFEGGKPEIPWPSSGQAALDVQGIGTFGSSGEQKPVPIASVAKVMTAYVILRDHPLKSGADGPMIAIDQAAEEQSDAGDESTVHVYAGDKISQREALDAILIASANNVARLLARWDAGSEKAFVEKMNAAAKDLGMTNTTYTDPSGLNDTTVSTAVDQVKLAKEAMKSVAFREVAQKMSYDDYKGENHSNWNQLVGHNGVVGIKTGTTTSALGNLVFAAKKEVGGETRTIVGAVVRQPPGGKDNTILGAALDSSDKLIRAAQDTLESSTILKKGDVVGYVDDGLGGRTPVVATEDVKAVGWPGLTVKLTFEADEVPHTAAAGTKVGTLTVGDGGAAGAVKVPVALQKDLVEPALTDKLTRLG